MRWVGHVTGIGERTGAYTGWGKLEGKRLLGKPRHRWKDNKIDLQEIVLGRGACSGLTWFRIGTQAFEYVNELSCSRIF
jgi:hypothetical protein